MKKKAQKHLIAFSRSLSFKLFIVLLFLVSVIFLFYATLCSTMQKQIYEHTIELSAYRVSDIIKKSLYRLMLTNERDELLYTLQLIANEPGLENIRIYNKKGEIKFSKHQSEIGNTIDMKAEACYACHIADEPIRSLTRPEKTRIYHNPDNFRIMGMINPVRNTPECSNAPCHAHKSEQTILGILDVQMSLRELDQAVNRARFNVFMSSIIFLIVAMIVFSISIYIVIYKPIESLKDGTVRLALGDLDYRIKMNSRDELGMLARSFNNMAENLKRAYDELKDWSYKLAERVKKKTSELERMHKGMLQVEKMASLGKMAASVAHELNNPIAGIVNYSKLIKKRVAKNIPESDQREKILRELELIRSESMRCGNIVSNLLAFARGTSTHFQEVVISDIIDRALRIIQHHMKLAEVEAKKNIELENEVIFCDTDQLLQAFIAIFVNAIEAMPEGGKLFIIVKDIPDDLESIRIEIMDTGLGIPDDILDKVFEPFFTTKKDKKGVGLGLSIVYGIIERHGGKIWVESKVKKGTTFFINLPIKHPNLQLNA